MLSLLCFAFWPPAVPASFPAIPALSAQSKLTQILPGSTLPFLPSCTFLACPALGHSAPTLSVSTTQMLIQTSATASLRTPSS
jgi:hypothetical protein